MNLEFRSVEELYKRVYPALRTKQRELSRSGYTYITEEDIWNFLKQNKWSKSQDLTLSDMVDDILNTEKEEFDNFLKIQLKEKERNIYFNDLEVL